MLPDAKVTDRRCSGGSSGRESRAIRRHPHNAASALSMTRSIPSAHRTTPQASTNRDIAATGRGPLIPLSPTVALLLGGCASSFGGDPAGEIVARPPIALGGSDVRSATRPADLVRIAADLTLDLEAPRLYGTATSTLRMMRSGVGTLRLDAEGLEVREIVDGDGRALRFRVLPDSIEVLLEEPVPVGDELAVTVRYAATGEGALRVSLDDGGTFRPEAYALGTRGALARWLPTSAPPGELATVELALTVRDGAAVVSNGEPAGTNAAAPGALERVVRWQQLEPIPVESIAIAAGRFESVAAETDRVAFHVHLPEGTAPSIARRTAADSAQALRHLMVRLQRRFPFARHDHVVMRSVGAGHFEGATMSITGVDELGSASDVADERRERSRRAVYRGLVRAWFGAWIVPLGERHRWLLDGLACQLELDHEALVRGEAEAALEWEEHRERLVRRARELTASVADIEDPDLAREFDALRAGWAMRMLRARLGEEDHWRVVRRFAAVLEGPQYAASRVVTGEDFRRAVLDEVGIDLGPELAQWSERIAVPELEITMEPRGAEDGRDSLVIVVRQVQPGPLFDVALDLELHFEGGNSRVETLRFDGPESRLSVPLHRPLVDVIVDPFGAILACLRVEKDEAAWLAQGLLSRPAVQRQRALPELERLALAGSAAASQALVRALLESPEPGLRTRAAGFMTFPGPAGVTALLRSAADDPSPSVRAASLHGLLQAFAAERWLPSADDLQALLALRQREAAPVALERIERLLQTIPAR